LVLVAMLAGAVPSSAADDVPKPLTPRRLFDQSRPGVQLITVQFSAGLVVPDATVTEINGRALEAIAADRIRRGQIPATAAAASGAIVDEIARDPFRWFTASSRVHRSKVKLTATGSGFSVSPDGYIVTNAHVVAPKDDSIKAAFLARAFRDNGDDFVAAIRQEGLTQRQATRFLGAIVRWSTRMTKLANYKRTITVLGSTGSGTSSSSKRRAARLVDAGEEFPGKDVAVIKVDARNMATVQLGDDTALSTGDRLFVLGFPGAATFNPVLSKASQREPTLTQGVLSAKKQVNGGYTVLQTDAGMTHGNSGGPVFDEQGRVIGVATLGSVDPNTGQEVSGLNFAVPASIVNELLRQTHVTASDGTVGGIYREALDDYDQQWYKRALPLLQRVRALDPGHPLVGKLIKDSQTAIAQGRDRTPREILGLSVPVAAGLAGVVVVLMGIGALTLRSRRRRGARGARSGPAASPGWGAQGTGWTQGGVSWPQGGASWSPQDAGRTPQGASWVPDGPAWGSQDAGRGTEPRATQPIDLGTPHAEGQDDAWWQERRYRRLVAPPASAAAAPSALADDDRGQPSALADDDRGHGYEYEDGQHHNATPYPRHPRQASTAAAQAWWNADEAETTELTAPGDVDFAQPVQSAEPAGADPATQPGRPAARSQPTPAQPTPAQPTPAQPTPAQPTPALVCWNCGRHNHPSLHYCEQCWTVLS
jgi:serine protease Do